MNIVHSPIDKGNESQAFQKYLYLNINERAYILTTLLKTEAAYFYE